MHKKTSTRTITESKAVVEKAGMVVTEAIKGTDAVLHDDSWWINVFQREGREASFWRIPSMVEAYDLAADFVERKVKC